MISVLYVDDEQDLLEIGKLYLERTGEFRVATVTSAPVAISIIQSEKYDAIISDYQMPDMNGIDLLKKIRASGNTIPFIIFTGRGREEVVIQALNEGVDFYIQKGGDPGLQFAELAHKVRQAVHTKQAEDNRLDLERREADIINFLPDATFAINTAGVVIAWNRAIGKMTGVTAE
jgi:DNA-binding response OmpR family regulator